MGKFCFPRVETNRVTCHTTGLRVGRPDVENRNMIGSDRPSSSTTEINKTRIGEMIQNDRRVKSREISSELGLSYGRVQHIVSDVLRYFKTVL
ncbi:hypothetical protein TNCV_979911 [Trichonephila clavipes]|uniref:Uncharacterized protein n=1 Tax=Trichonephila clavipes TaxID=2585209 RepID=A0A8X6RZF8_TRICX|nr:hypothetical protein TNCV_979911 [Trichonephila clavipes]